MRIFANLLFTNLVVLLCFTGLAVAAQETEEEEASSSESYSRGSEDRSSDAADWDELPASYAGLLPCADCPGIQTQLNLFSEGWYALSMLHLEDASEPSYELGRWTFSSSSETLLLNDGSGSPASWRRVDTGRLRLVERVNRVLEGRLNSELTREPVFQWFSPTLSLRGMYSNSINAESFTDCLTGQRWPLARLSGSVALQRAYGSAAITDGSALLVDLEAVLAMLPRQDGIGYAPTLAPLRLLEVYPGEDCSDYVDNPQDPQDPGYSNALEDTRWRLTAVAGTNAGISSQRTPYIVLSSEDDSLQGSGGCNGIGGSYSLRGETLSFNEIMSTMMYCEDLMDVERAFLDALENTASWSISGDFLKLFGSDGVTLARFVVSEEQ